MGASTEAREVAVQRRPIRGAALLRSAEMRKLPWTQTPVSFPLSRKCRNLGWALAVFAVPATAVAVALILWAVLLLLDENGVIGLPKAVTEQGNPAALAALAALAASSLPMAVVYSAWAAAGRRDLYLAAGGTGSDRNRPSDRQMRWFLKDAHPWEAAATAALLWAALGALVGGASAPAIYLAGDPDDLPLGHFMLGLAVVAAVILVVCFRVLRGLMALAVESAEDRDRRWPLPEGSDLRQSLARSTGGNGGGLGADVA